MIKRSTLIEEHDALTARQVPKGFPCNDSVVHRKHLLQGKWRRFTTAPCRRREEEGDCSCCCIGFDSVNQEGVPLVLEWTQEAVAQDDFEGAIQIRSEIKAGRLRMVALVYLLPISSATDLVMPYQFSPTNTACTRR